MRHATELTGQGVFSLGLGSSTTRVWCYVKVCQREHLRSVPVASWRQLLVSAGARRRASLCIAAGRTRRFRRRDTYGPEVIWQDVWE